MNSSSQSGGDIEAGREDAPPKKWSVSEETIERLCRIVNNAQHELYRRWTEAQKETFKLNREQTYGAGVIDGVEIGYRNAYHTLRDLIIESELPQKDEPPRGDGGAKQPSTNGPDAVPGMR